MTLAEDLDAAIRERLDWAGDDLHSWGHDVIAAVVAVLDRCNAINSMMFASEVRCLIAEALGVPQAGKPGQP